MDQVTDFNIIETVRDTAKYGDKIDALIKAKKDAEKAKAEAEAATVKLRRRETEADSYVAAKKAELAAKQQEHDKAAAEAAARIKANHDQMAEVQRVLAEVNAKKSDLDGRERDMARREKTLQETIDSISNRQKALDKATDLIRRQQVHIAAMPKS